MASLPSISSRTPLRGHHSRSASSVSLPFAVVAALNPKRNRNRLSIIALLVLVSLSAFVLCTYFPIAGSPTYLLRAHHPGSGPDQVVLAADHEPNAKLAASRKKQHKQLAGSRKPLVLSSAQELAAVSSFLASLPQNVIPLSVDPARPIDPELVLDFDTRSPGAKDEVARVVDYVWAQNPVFLYSKVYSPASRELKSILSSLNLLPPPTIIDVDTRDDAEVLTPLLARLTSTPELPVLLLGGVPIGGVEEVRELHRSGELAKRIAEAGAVVGASGKRRKGHRK